MTGCIAYVLIITYITHLGAITCNNRAPSYTCNRAVITVELERLES